MLHHAMRKGVSQTARGSRNMRDGAPSDGTLLQLDVGAVNERCRMSCRVCSSWMQRKNTPGKEVQQPRYQQRCGTCRQPRNVVVQAAGILLTNLVVAFSEVTTGTAWTVIHLAP